MWQALHLATSTCTLRGRRGACENGLALVARLVPVGHPWHFAWQAWRLATPAFVLCGGRGTCRHAPALCVAGVALGDMDVAIAWQVRHFISVHVLLYQADRRDVVCHLVGRGRGMTRVQSNAQCAQAASSGRPVVTKLHARFNFGFCLLEEVDLWGCPVLQLVNRIVRAV